MEKISFPLNKSIQQHYLFTGRQRSVSLTIRDHDDEEECEETIENPYGFTEEGKPIIGDTFPMEKEKEDHIPSSFMFVRCIQQQECELTFLFLMDPGSKNTYINK